MTAKGRLPAVAAALTVLLVFGAWVSWLAGGFTLSDAADSYLLSNSVMALTFTGFGVLVLSQRSGHPIGRLFVAFGACYTASVACLGIVTGVGDLSPAWERAFTAVGISIWIPAPLVCLPLILQLFPDGRPLSDRWRWLVAVTLGLTVTAPLLVLRPDALAEEEIADSGPLLPDGAGQVASGVLPFFVGLGLLVLLISVVSLGLRARRSTGVERLQVMWLLWAVSVFVLLNAQRLVTTNGPVLFLLTMALIPAAATVAIVRYELYDISLIVNRSIVYGLLTAGVVASYLGLVALLGDFSTQHTEAAPLVAVGAIAVAFAPVRSRLQSSVDHLLYGRRRDPSDATARVVVRLGDGLDGVLAAVCDTLRLPYVAVIAGGRVVTDHGRLPEHAETFALDVPDGPDADLLIGLRPGESHLSAADRRALTMLVAPITLAWQAVNLSHELQDSRARIVTAREEERRRLRRDLHDGLGSALTAVTLKVDAAHNLSSSDPHQTAELLVQLRSDLTSTIDEIRRLVQDLRPQALDELGLVGALRQRADHAWRRDDGSFRVTIDAPASLPSMPAAVEVAAYRIAAEAVTNTLRHSHARCCAITVRVDGGLHVEVSDDGGRPAAPWEQGIGLMSMNERATELGGRLTAGPTDQGGWVHAVLPLNPA